LPPLPAAETNAARKPVNITVLGTTNQTVATSWRDHLALASKCESLGQYEKAVAEYEKVIELRPGVASAYNYLAWAYVTWPPKFRSPEKALPLALKAVGLSKTNHNELNTLGIVYYRLGKLTDAILTLEAGIKADKAGGSAHDFFFLAMACHRLGDSTKAQDYFTKGTNWMAAPPKLSPDDKKQVEDFRAEADAVLATSQAK